MLFNKVSPKNKVHTRLDMLSNCNNPACLFTGMNDTSWSTTNNQWSVGQMVQHIQVLIKSEWKCQACLLQHPKGDVQSWACKCWFHTINTRPQGLNSNAQWYQSHPWKLLHKFGEFRLWTVVQLLCTLKDSSNYGHKIHLHRSTCGLFLHYRWIDGFQKQITFRL